jgi:hypothetical protein
VVNKQIVIKRVGMIEVSDLAIVERQILEVAIVGILLDEDHLAGLHRFQDAVCHGGFSRSGPAGNAND